MLKNIVRVNKAYFKGKIHLHIMKKSHLQNLIKEKESETPKLSLDEKLAQLIQNESAITVKKIKYYLKDLKTSVSVYKSLEKKLPEIEINILSDEPFFKIKNKNKEHVAKFVNVPLHKMTSQTFLLNIKSKNKKQTEEMLLDLTDLWHASDCSLEMHELLGLSESEYKSWLNNN